MITFLILSSLGTAALFGISVKLYISLKEDMARLKEVNRKNVVFIKKLQTLLHMKVRDKDEISYDDINNYNYRNS